MKVNDELYTLFTSDRTECQFWSNTAWGIFKPDSAIFFSCNNRMSKNYNEYKLQVKLAKPYIYDFRL